MDAEAEAKAKEFHDRLRSRIGESGAEERARDAVNPSMIRHWCDAMEDHNPAYTDPAWATASVHGGLVAPPAMLNAWTMRGLVPQETADPNQEIEGAGAVYGELDAAGYTSVVATNSEHEYDRYLKVGDLIQGHGRVEDVSAEKTTGLGIGHFVTTLTEYTNQDGESVGRMRFRILKFRPGTGRSADAGEVMPPPPRPEPGISRDTAFFWDGLEAGELRIQRCQQCGILHHPPVVRCPACGSYAFDYQVASGRGTLYSHVEPVHPPFASFEPPYVVGLVELEEGTRLITNVVDLDPERVEIGMPLELVVGRRNSERNLPFFRPVRPERRSETLSRSQVKEGDVLGPCPVPITATLIVATAIASRDYQDVHHDRELAVLRGSPDIFMNILTTSGLVSRYVTDWAGPEAMLRKLSIRLGAPNYPHDTMTFYGAVNSVRDGRVEVGIQGLNKLGPHVTGTVELELP